MKLKDVRGLYHRLGKKLIDSGIDNIKGITVLIDNKAYESALVSGLEHKEAIAFLLAVLPRIHGGVLKSEELNVLRLIAMRLTVEFIGKDDKSDVEPSAAAKKAAMDIIDELIKGDRK